MRVVISGAGIAGPALAWFLARSGAQVTILEKSPSLLAQGQNIDIEGAAREVIAKMGLTEEIRKQNTTEKGTQFIDSKGRKFAPFPLQEGHRSSFTSEFEILRGDLASILCKATKDHPNVKYIFGTTIEKVISNDEHSVTVELTGGDVQEFDIAVAADGQWSKLRRQCFPSEDVKTVDKNMYIAYYTVPKTAKDNNWWNIYQALDRRVISLRPDPYGTTKAMLSLMPSNDTQKQTWEAASRSDRKIQSELVKKEFADAGWEAQRLLDAMDEAPDFYFHGIKQIRMSRWSTSRVVCLGDAAHAPTPLTGMGTSLALIGAYLLGGEIGNLTAGQHPSVAFENYETTFRPFVEEIQDIPSFVPGIAHPRTAFRRKLLHTFVWLCSQIVKVSWIKKLAEAKADDQDKFDLPHYPALDEE